MNNLLIEDTKIIAFGEIEYIPKSNQVLIQNYSKAWPVDDNNDKLPKKLCYWNIENQSVEEKLPAMIAADEEERLEKVLYGTITWKIPEWLIDCANNTLTFEELLDKIRTVLLE